ncbi:MAG TPA: GNAT family N-acetyltransferase [Solirubrobacteraceae bacterium]|nr:GNAT family N-acetyltransferase [Solirubrobacteraceae bacterium]
MSDAARIRPAAEADVPALVALVAEYVVDFYGSPDPGSDALEVLVRMLLEGAEGTQFVAERDGALVGFATLYFPWSTLSAARTCLMNDLYVVAAERGAGTAAALFEACRAHARAHGHAELGWETAQDNDRARAFYAKMGGVAGPWVVYTART